MASSSSSSSSDPKTIFTLHNLPYGIVSDTKNAVKRCATVYEDHVVDLDVLHRQGLFESIPEIRDDNVFANTSLNAFAALPRSVRGRVRSILKQILGSSSSSSPSKSSSSSPAAAAALIPLSEVQNHFPMDTRNFSDFYCSYEHGLNCSETMGGKLPSNWFVQPSVYNGRTSSLVVSGTPVRRPWGVYSPSATTDHRDHSAPPVFAPETQFDFELEMGVFLSEPVPRGERLSITQAKDHIFGFVLLNDWSSRMIQFFEMTPLGPFHAKGSGTSVSPWIVPIEALDETASCPRQIQQDPPPLSNLLWSTPEDATYNIDVSCKIIRDGRTYQIAESNLNELYWTPFQMITHLGCAGEGLSTGDIFGTGTISSSRTNTSNEYTGLACLWERKLAHKTKLSGAPPNIAQTLLIDGDEVVFEAWVRGSSSRSSSTDNDDSGGQERQEERKILLGFGECRGKVLPAK